MNSLLSKKTTIFLFLFVLPLTVTSQIKKTTEERLHINDSLYSIAISSNNDSLRTKTLGEYVILYYRKRKWELLNTYRKQHIPLTYQFNDTLGRAKTFKYTAKYFNIKNEIDSAYYYSTQSFKEYNNIHDSLQAGYRLLNLGILRKNVRDYTGSEYKCRLALKYLGDKAKPRQTASIYNTLATNYSELEEYEKALEYHYKSLQLRREEVKDTILIVHSLASIGDVHITRKNYNKAIEVLNETKPFKKQIAKDSKVESVVLDNLTYARFKNGETDDFEKLFNKAIELGKKVKYEKVQTNALLHLAEYCQQRGDNIYAIGKVINARNLAKKNKDFNAYIRSLEMLGNLFSGDASKKYFNELNTIRDSLDKAQIRSLNLFLSMELQVEDKDSQIIRQDKELKNQSNTISILGIISAIAVMAFIFIVVIKRKQKRQLSLKIESTEQELEDKKLQLKTIKSYGVEQHNPEYQKALEKHLRKHFNLNRFNLEFWNVFIKDLSQEEQMEILGIKKDGLDKRRVTLREKIKKVRDVDSPFTSKTARNIYLEEEEKFKKGCKK